MERLSTIAAVREAVSGARGHGARIALVPTMGALHRGHLSLVRLAADLADLAVVSIFVNPTQFGPDEDLDAYPRELASDEAKLRALGEDAPQLVFAPDVKEMYPQEPVTRIHVERLTERLCGASRPRHFDGVCTVVAKLLNIVRPDAAVFGRKDFQQLVVVRRVVADLDVSVEIVGAPVVREPDGVAMSTRNRYLDPPQRSAARALSQGLRRAVEAARQARERGRPTDPERLREAVLATLESESHVRVDYVEVVDPDTLEPPDPGRATVGGGEGNRDDVAMASEQHLLVAVAAHVGPARLIDNVLVGDIDDEDRLLEATAVPVAD